MSDYEEEYVENEYDEINLTPLNPDDLALIEADYSIPISDDPIEEVSFLFNSYFQIKSLDPEIEYEEQMKAYSMEVIQAVLSEFEIPTEDLVYLFHFILVVESFEKKYKPYREDVIFGGGNTIYSEDALPLRVKEYISEYPELFCDLEIYDSIFNIDSELTKAPTYVRVLHMCYDDLIASGSIQSLEALLQLYNEERPFAEEFVEKIEIPNSCLEEFRTAFSLIVENPRQTRSLQNRYVDLKRIILQKYNQEEDLTKWVETNSEYLQSIEESRQINKEHALLDDESVDESDCLDTNVEELKTKLKQFTGNKEQINVKNLKNLVQQYISQETGMANLGGALGSIQSVKEITSLIGIDDIEIGDDLVSKIGKAALNKYVKNKVENGIAKQKNIESGDEENEMEEEYGTEIQHAALLNNIKEKGLNSLNKLKEEYGAEIQDAALLNNIKEKGLNSLNKLKDIIQQETSQDDDSPRKKQHQRESQPKKYNRIKWGSLVVGIIVGMLFSIFGVILMIAIWGIVFYTPIKDSIPYLKNVKKKLIQIQY